MKKFTFLLLLVAVCFFCGSAVLGAVKIKPKAENQVLVQKHYSAEEIAAANLWARSRPLNDLQNENLIYPGGMLIFAYPQKEDRWMAPIQKGDWVLKISKRLVQGGFVTRAINPEPVTEFKPQKVFVPVLPDTTKVKSYLNWCWGLLLCLIIALLALAYAIVKSAKAKKENKEEINFLKNSEDLLAKELEKTRNMLPVNPLPIVDEWWLRHNNPVGSGRNIQNVTFSGIGIQGEMPDLIVRARVSTAENAVKMDFSHNRKATTGLKDVAVWLGWNWNTEESKWVEVGMIASVCANGFQMNPEKVQKISQLFTKFELVNPDQHPVVHESDNLPKDDFKYPSLIRGLVMKYHAEHITDLNKAGAVVVPKNTNEEKKG